ncbi:type I restriction-modification system subunit M N-terminal domain-containing protein [Segatella copri]
MNYARYKRGDAYEKANLIWAIADKLVGTYKPHEYGQVILPLCVIHQGIW